MKTEREFQKEVIKKLKEQGVWHYKNVVTNVNGIPDIACIIKGKPIYLELKRDEKAKLSALQRWQGEQIEKAGGYFYRVDNLNQLENILNEHLND